MYRQEYPRPDFKRKEWMNLNGTWDFRLEEKEWSTIEVPFAPQSKLSGLNDNRMYDFVTYRRSFFTPEAWKGQNIWIRFGGVDYQCKVYINGSLIGSHTGGNSSFGFEISQNLLWNHQEEIRVEVYDPCEDETIPRGKQYWKPNSESIWYTRTTGIWQTVWLEPTDPFSFDTIRFTPDIDKGSVFIEYGLTKKMPDARIHLRIKFQGEIVCDTSMSVFQKYASCEIVLFEKKIFCTMTHDGGWCWSPERPNLFETEIYLYDGDSLSDQIESYFGMRKIETKKGIVYLNNRPYYQKLILDQGYWPEGLMTAEQDEDYIKDIEAAKAMGFNGCRKHQKAEDPRFLYHADRLGFLVWSEIGACVSYSIEASQRTLSEWSDLVLRDYNHPCIVAWVVLNESWGVPNISFDKMQQSHALALYHNVRSMDSSRLVIANDGWELVKSDICAIHNYNHGSKTEQDKQRRFRLNLSTAEELLNSTPAGRQIYAEGYSYQGEPILLTEFGGLSYSNDARDGWGYTMIEDEAEFIETYERLITDIKDSSALNGYCYTQLSDVEQEMNGLLTYDRKFKVDPEKIRQINSMTGQ